MSTPFDPNQPRPMRETGAGTPTPQGNPGAPQPGRPAPGSSAHAGQPQQGGQQQPQQGAPAQHGVPAHGADLNKGAHSPQPHAAQQGTPQQGGHPGMQGAGPGRPPQGMPPQGGPGGLGAPGGPMQGQPGMPQHPLDTGAPSQARLPQRLGDDGKNTPIGFGRLVSVELRKTLDTRAGKWLLGATAAIIILVSALVAYNGRDHVSFYNLIGAAIIPMNYLVPILGILTVTSEWSQRTGLVTFTLEPRRAHVALAKLVATLLLSAVAAVIAFASAALFTVIMGSVGSGDPDWHLNGAAYGTILLYTLIQGAIGVAFGLLVQNTPGAICAFLFIPILVSMLNLMSWGQTVAEWINPNQALSPLVDGWPGSGQWGKIAVCLAVWLVLPMVFGFMRLNKREVKSS